MTAYGFTGGHIEGFREGWAVLPFVGKHPRPHYWRREDLTHRYRSLCGLVEDQEHYHPGARRVFAPGAFVAVRCQRCARQHERGLQRLAGRAAAANSPETRGRNEAGPMAAAASIPDETETPVYQLADKSR